MMSEDHINQVFLYAYGRELPKSQVHTERHRLSALEGAFVRLLAELGRPEKPAEAAYAQPRAR
jgi:hypothetical protein